MYVNSQTESYIEYGQDGRPVKGAAVTHVVPKVRAFHQLVGYLSHIGLVVSQILPIRKIIVLNSPNILL